MKNYETINWYTAIGLYETSTFLFQTVWNVEYDILMLWQIHSMRKSIKANDEY